jgi:hypothetical protein
MKWLKKIVIISIGLILACKYGEAQDLALHKPYTLSVLPNYPYTAPSTDKSSLTDGVYTEGYFWSKPTTVGWVRRPVTITIDLGSIQPVGAVTFNSVRRSDQNVDFPQNIYVFLSPDSLQFKYVGDAGKDSNGKGSYLVRKFVLNEINLNARYVSITAFPQGNNLFCDEIEVLKSKNLKSPQTIASGFKDIKVAIDSLKNNDFFQKNIELRASKIRSSTTDNKEKKEILQLIQPSPGSVSAKNAKSLSERINQLHANSLTSQFKSPFIVEKYSAWDTIGPLHYPLSDEESLTYQFLIPKDGEQYGAFLLTNNSPISQTFTFSETGANLSSLHLFNVPYVQSINGTLIPDPLVPVKSKVIIASGVSQLFIFKISGDNEGLSNYQIAVTSRSRTIRLNIGVQTIDYKGLSSNSPLNAVNWAYLSSPLLNDRKDQASLDLKNHGINTIVVPPQFLSKPGNNNFTGLINYLSHFKYAQNILLSTGYATAGNRHIDSKIQFLSNKWKNDFNEWYKQLLVAVRTAGISSKIYFYPFDEVPDAYIGMFKDFVNWAKNSVPELKIYATLSSKQAVDTIMPLIDIAQLQVPLTLKLPDGLPSHQSKVWIYSGSSPAKSLSPYSFYRMMAWQAFANDLTGVGFWNYADEGPDKQKNLITDPFMGPGSSYSVIYDGDGQEILSSRRWEAFSLGIQDYSILQLYANKFGLVNAKKFALRVINNPQNTSLADAVITEMLKAL